MRTLVKAVEKKIKEKGNSMKRFKWLQFYSICMTAILAFILFVFCMYNFTNKDLLEILVLFVTYILPIALIIPMLISEG